MKIPDEELELWFEKTKGKPIWVIEREDGFDVFTHEVEGAKRIDP